MRRRDFIAGFGGAVTWPISTRAQQSKAVIGFLSAGAASNSPNLAPFLQGLREAGFIEGQNVDIVYRWADGRNERLGDLAADLVQRRVAVICAIGGTLPAIAAKQVTATIPIVFQFGGDPVTWGVVASLSRPGGNATGAMNMAGGPADAKAVEYLRELIPTASSLAVLVNPTNRPRGIIEAHEAAQALKWSSDLYYASSEAELAAAFEKMAIAKIGALNVVPDPFFTSRRDQIVSFAERYAIPASYSFRDFVIAGGLMSYGADLREGGRLAGIYAGRILKGEKPADLPVQQATRVELVLNLKTAKALGLTVPMTLLARADEVIE
jgi:putative tryptophan/tyrosine transport system substrate-binding protein